MNKNLRWKLIAILAVIVIRAWAIYPPSREVRLGLDLKGGVHLVLQVQTDDALRLGDRDRDGRSARRPGEGRRAGRDGRIAEPHRVPDQRRAARQATRSCARRRRPSRPPTTASRA